MFSKSFCSWRFSSTFFQGENASKGFEKCVEGGSHHFKSNLWRHIVWTSPRPICFVDDLFFGTLFWTKDHDEKCSSKNNSRIHTVQPILWVSQHFHISSVLLSSRTLLWTFLEKVRNSWIIFCEYVHFAWWVGGACCDFRDTVCSCTQKYAWL